MKKLKICCISDTHQHHKKVIVPKCDLIIHAGDFTYHGTIPEVIKFLDWYQIQPAKYKVLICGNHEVEISESISLLKEMCKERDIIYLHNDYTFIEGFTIFGSPYSVEFGNWAFGLPDESLYNDIYQYVSDVDILVVHGPPYGKLDRCPGGNVGSKSLVKKLNELEGLKLLVTGHIHESRGCLIDENGLVIVNAAMCGIPYTDVLANPIVVTLEK